MRPVWRDDLSDQEWDDALAALGGHPLQSAHWGRARQCADGRGYVSLVRFDEMRPVWMARAEIRYVPLLGNVAWIPRGPTLAGTWSDCVNADGFQRLAAMGFILCAATPWRRMEDKAVDTKAPRTIWIDLTKGHDQLWALLQKKWRHGVNHAERAGVKVQQTSDDSQVHAFFELCRSISQTKGFILPASEVLMKGLLGGPSDAPVSSHLFLASHADQMAAGAFIVRCGQSIHYLWGATDRKLAGLRAGEAVQWAVIEWALTQGCTLYDLEGIDPQGNPGVYQFKKKMGGEEVNLAPLEAISLSMRGTLLAPLVARFLG